MKKEQFKRSKNSEKKEVKKMNSVLLRSFMVCFVLMFMAYGTAHALPSVTNAFTEPITTASDDNGEVIVDNVGIPTMSPWSGQVSPTLDMGDYLVGVVGITSWGDGTDPASINQLTGIFALEVSTVGPTVPDSLCFSGAAGTTGACSSFAFSPVGAGFNAAVAAAFGVGPFTDIGGGALPGSTVAIVFEGPPNDFLRAGNPAGYDPSGNAIDNEQIDAVTAAINGTQRMVIGALMGDTWESTFGPRWIGDALVAAGLSPTLKETVGGFRADLTILSYDFPGWILGPDFTLNNGAFSGDLTGAIVWPISSNTDVEFLSERIRIPEPTTFSLFGMGLLGLWAIGRRRQNKR
jgi:hypothetical protein